MDKQDNYLATSAAAASTLFSGTPSEPDPMAAKLHAKHAITAQDSQSPDTLLIALAESSEVPQHVQEELPEQEASVDSEPEREEGGFGSRFARNLRENLQKFWNNM